MTNRMQTTIAPDFILTGTNGNPVQLSDFRGRKNVVLVLLRGFR